MAKTDKGSKSGTSKKVDQIKENPTVPASSKDILAKATALARSTSNALANGKQAPSASSDDSSDSSSAEESSSGESESSEEPSPPPKSTPAAVKKTADVSDDSSDASSSEESSTSPTKAKTVSDPEENSSTVSSSEESSSESDSDEKDKGPPAPPLLALTEVNKKRKAGNETVALPKEDSSTVSSSEESSSESDSDEEDRPPAPPPAHVEVNKKRKADNETVALPKKVKLANGSASGMPSGEETRSIFVGRLSWNVDNDWLAQEFAECGEVESANVQMDRNTGRSRGFGYVHFKTADAVEKAIALNGKEIDGRAVNIDKSHSADKKTSTEKRAQAFGDTPSPPSAVLFVGNLSFGVNEDTLWEAFGEHGDVKSVRVPTDRDTGKPKGFAYVEFSDVGAAKKAHQALQGFELDGRSIRLDFSHPRDSAGGRGGGQGGRGGRGRGGFGGDRGRGGGRGGFSRGGRGGDRARGGRGRGVRTGGIAHFEGQKITFD